MAVVQRACAPTLLEFVLVAPVPPNRVQAGSARPWLSWILGPCALELPAALARVRLIGLFVSAAERFIGAVVGELPVRGTVVLL